jgi:hypothetical protein
MIVCLLKRNARLRGQKPLNSEHGVASFGLLILIRACNLNILVINAEKQERRDPSVHQVDLRRRLASRECSQSRTEKRTLLEAYLLT